uniref:Uncharacterized protein n=1 Tax=Caenorhabditis japonica TaxID=281687 RepID=A0A8R1I3Q8_CAEJA
MAADSIASLSNRYLDSNDADMHFLRTWAVRRCQHTDWDVCERIRLGELQEEEKRALSEQLYPTDIGGSEDQYVAPNRSPISEKIDKTCRNAVVQTVHSISCDPREPSSSDASVNVELREQLRAESEFLKDQASELQKCREKIAADEQSMAEMRARIQKMEGELMTAKNSKRASSS